MSPRKFLKRLTELGIVRGLNPVSPRSLIRERTILGILESPRSIKTDISERRESSGEDPKRPVRPEFHVRPPAPTTGYALLTRTGGALRIEPTEGTSLIEGILNPRLYELLGRAPTRSSALKKNEFSRGRPSLLVTPRPFVDFVKGPTRSSVLKKDEFSRGRPPLPDSTLEEG